MTNQEMQDAIIALQGKVTMLENENKSLKANTTIPFEVEGAFRQRLGIDYFTALDTSSKTAASETQAVSEGGSASYSVAKPMDGFRQVVIGGSTIYIPYYT